MDNLKAKGSFLVFREPYIKFPAFHLSFQNTIYIDIHILTICQQLAFAFGIFQSKNQALRNNITHLIAHGTADLNTVHSPPTNCLLRQMAHTMGYHLHFPSEAGDTLLNLRPFHFQIIGVNIHKLQQILIRLNPFTFETHGDRVKCYL